MKELRSPQGRARDEDRCRVLSPSVQQPRFGVRRQRTGEDPRRNSQDLWIKFPA